MKAYIIAESGRITAASFDSPMVGAACVDVPEDFDLDRIHEYAFDGTAVSHEPIEDEESAEYAANIYERVAALEEQIDMLLSGVTSDE